MRSSSKALALLAATLLTLATDADAGIFGRQAASYAHAPAAPSACPGGRCPAPAATTQPARTYTHPIYVQPSPAPQPQPVAQPQYRFASATAAAPAQAVAAVPVVGTLSTEAHFLSWLNDYRARNGRGPVGWDQSLANDAAVNNSLQRRNGMGHWAMGRARRQNSAMGPYSAVPGMWQRSAAHNAALLDPTVTAVGLAGDGSYWTLSLR